MPFTNQILTFQSEAVGEDKLVVTKLEGDERLSGSFRFDLQLMGSRDEAASLDLSSLLYQPAKVGIRQPLQLAGGEVGSRTLWYEGVLAEIEQLGMGKEWVEYRAVLVPRVWLLNDFWRSRIFQKLTIQELITELLHKGELGLAPNTDFDLSGLTRAPAGSDRLARAVYPEREYVVQYEESDYDFLMRWLEHEGIFFFFENDGTQEKLLFGDTVGAYKRVGNQPSFPYRPETAAARDGEEQGNEEIKAFHVQHARLPKAIKLRDYNWRNPSAVLSSAGDVFGDGVGVQHEYNDHYKTQAQGDALATVRAEERRCQGVTIQGQSTCRGFRPGRTFTLAEHFVSKLDGDYMLTAVSHHAEQVINLEVGSVTGASYTNDFQAIPADVAWRPQRLTSWPSIKGVMHARVDGSEDGAYAELDSLGRYKLTIPFDDKLDDATPGEASRWVRMAQPYAGTDSGFHFPLLKGTEVIVTHIDGDPDRPIIASAVPNPESTSPVDSSNVSQNRMQTTSGNLFMMDDHADGTGFVMIDGGGRTVQDFRMPRRGGEGSVGPGAGYGSPGVGPRRAPSGATPARQASAEAQGADSGDAPSPPASARRSPGEAPPLPADSPLRMLSPAGGPLPKSVIDRWRQQATTPAAGKAMPEGYTDLSLPGTQNVNVNTDTDGDFETTSGTTNDGDFGQSTRIAGYDTDGDGEVDCGATADDEGAEAVYENKSALEYFVDEIGAAGTANAALNLFATEGTSPSSVSGGLNLESGRTYLLDAAEWNPAIRLRYWVGDFMLIKDGGDQSAYWTYDNVSNNISFGTGGYSYSQDGTSSSDADNTSVSYHYGKDTSYSEHHGDSESTSKTYGNHDNYEWVHGNGTSESYNFAAKFSFSLTIAATSEVDIKIGAFNSNSVLVGGKVDTDIVLGVPVPGIGVLGGSASMNIFVGGKAELEITAAVAWKCEVGAVAKFTVDVEPTETELNVKQRNKFTLSDAEVILKHDHAELKKTKAALQETQAALKKDQAVLKKTLAALKDDGIFLSKANTALKKANTALKKQDTALSKSITALSDSSTSVDKTYTAAITKIQ